ncbi:hypothetical protein [Rubellicoccus peritrichatus]|uniref:Uncharacterized protein n=1 Tax=Rubellicoccus peritrichatus TaxID=3080537 RepID=A0AAQ3LC16_9BACT|nr:hypothetical protein [Puniceicoccus sp. CR14]WOO41647.1 hypothetical protein RZN69_01005 [Puniceicoccus sp. CR14]
MDKRITNQNQQPAKKVSGLVGFGLDNTDGHKRLTQGEKFVIAGGSEETHDRMTETVMKTFEDLKKSGRQIEDAEPKEVADLICKNTPE